MNIDTEKVPVVARMSLAFLIAFSLVGGVVVSAQDTSSGRSAREKRLEEREREGEEKKAKLKWSNAESAYLVREYETARKLYLAILQRFPKTNFAVRALARIGDVYRSEKSFKQAVEFYRRMIKRYETLPLERQEELRKEMIRARYMIGAAYYEQKNYRKVFSEFRRFIQDFPDSKYTNVAYFLIGQSHLANENFRAAIKAFDSVGTVRGLGHQSEETLISPGDLLYVQVEDADMRSAGLGERIKVQVTTTAGDLERVFLKPKGLGSPLFIGNIKTRLGKPQPTQPLEQLWSVEVDAEIDRRLKKTRELRRRVAELRDKREALEKKLKKVAADESLSGDEQLEAVGKLKDQISACSENIITSKRRSENSREWVLTKVDKAFSGIEEYLKKYAPDKTIEEVKKRLGKAKKEEQKKTGAGTLAAGATEVKEKEEQPVEEDKSVFSREEILKVRLAAGKQPTTLKNFDGRRAVLRYWIEQLLHDLKRLEVFGSDKISVMYRDKQVSTGQEDQMRKDIISLASDAYVVFVSDDESTAVSKEVYGSPCHIKVVDKDRDVSEDKDEIKVVLSVVDKESEEEKKEKAKEAELGEEETEAMEEEEMETEGQIQGGQTEYVDSYVDEGKNYKVVLEKTDEGDKKKVVEVDEEEEPPPLFPEGAPHATATLTETKEHSGVFTGVLEGYPRGVKVSGRDLVISPEQRLRCAYEDERNISRRKPWVVWAAVEFIPSSEGDVNVPEVADSKLNRRAQLEKGISQGELAKVYEDLGLEDMAELYFEKALQTCGKVAQMEGLTPLGQEATHAIWRLYFESGQTDKAVTACKQLIKEFPDSELVDEAYLTMGKALLNKAEEAEERSKEGLAREAISAFNGLLKAKPDSEYKAEALYKIGESLYAAGTNGARYMERVVKEHPDSSFASAALHQSGMHAYENNDYASAYEYLTRVLVDYPDAEALDKVMLMRGHCQVKRRKYSEALRAYYELIGSYPGSPYAKKAQKIIEYIKKKMAKAERASR
ncbi:MAG: tetratricopeptide repeat protein [Candidatus Brocadiia bacterium]